MAAFLAGTGKILGGATKAAAGATKVVAREGVRAGLIRGTRGRQRRRDRIQQGLFGKGEGGGMIGGGPLAIGSSSSIGSAIPTSQESIGQVPTGTGILGILQSIRSTLVQILEVEKQERDRIQESILNSVRDKERSQRTAEQQAQEAKKKSKGGGGIAGRVGGALKAPASNMFGALGDLVKIGAMDWLSDPANAKAIEGMIKFFKDLVGALQWLNTHLLGPIFNLGVAVLLTTVEGLGKVFDVLGNIFDGTIFSDPEKFFGDLLEIPRWLIADVIPRILGAVVEVLTFGMVKNGEQFIHGIFDAIKDGALGLQEPVAEADETKREALSDEKISPSTSENSAGENEALVQGTRIKDTSMPGDYDANKIKDIHNDPLGLRQDPTGLGGMKKFNKGGKVKGYNKGGGVDTIPAMLTLGEYVMSKPAVDFWGTGTLAAMNSLSSTNSTINNSVVNNTLINKLSDSSETGKALSQVQRESNILESSSIIGSSTQTIGVGSNTVNTSSAVVTTADIGNNYPSFGKTGTTYRTII